MREEHEGPWIVDVCEVNLDVYIKFNNNYVLEYSQNNHKNISSNL